MAEMARVIGFENFSSTKNKQVARPQLQNDALDPAAQVGDENIRWTEDDLKRHKHHYGPATKYKTLPPSNRKEAYRTESIQAAKRPRSDKSPDRIVRNSFFSDLDPTLNRYADDRQNLAPRPSSLRS